MPGLWSKCFTSINLVIFSVSLLGKFYYSGHFIDWKTESRAKSPDSTVRVPDMSTELSDSNTKALTYRRTDVSSALWDLQAPNSKQCALNSKHLCPRGATPGELLQRVTEHF